MNEINDLINQCPDREAAANRALGALAGYAKGDPIKALECVEAALHDLMEAQDEAATQLKRDEARHRTYRKASRESGYDLCEDGTQALGGGR